MNIFSRNTNFGVYQQQRRLDHNTLSLPTAIFCVHRFLYTCYVALILRLKKLKILEPNYGDEGRKVGSSFRISVIAGFSCIIGPTLICGFLFSMGANFGAFYFCGEKSHFFMNLLSENLLKF